MSASRVRKREKNKGTNRHGLTLPGLVLRILLRHLVELDAVPQLSQRLVLLCMLLALEGPSQKTRVIPWIVPMDRDKTSNRPQMWAGDGLPKCGGRLCSARP
jgi:hypothetical protein